MTPQKLLFFYYGHDDFSYGVAEVFRSVLLGVDRNKYKPILVYSGVLSKNAEAKLPGVELYQLNQKSLKKCIWPLYKLLRKIRPAILMTGTEHANIICSVLKLILLNSIKLVLSVHSPLTQRFQEMWSNKESQLLKLLIRYCYPLADSVVCVSNYVKHDVDQYAPKARTCVIGNPVKVNQDLQLLTSKRKSTRVLVVSRLVTNKRIEDLVYLVERNKSIEQLDIVGDGPCKPDLEELVRQCNVNRRVTFHGYADDPSAYYQKTDIFVLPSRWEGFGNVLVEAMSYGCQVIVNRGAGAPVEIIGNGEYGYLYEQGDIESLQEAFDACLSSPISVQKLFERASRFRASRAVGEYQQLLDKIVNKKALCTDI